jgi:hypothetical protein
LVRMKTNVPNDSVSKIDAVITDLDTQMDQLEREYA